MRRERRAGRDQMQDRGIRKDGGQIGDRDVPGDDPADQQIGGAEQQGRSRGFTDAAVDVAQKEILEQRQVAEQRHRRAGFERLLGKPQRRGGGHGVHGDFRRLRGGAACGVGHLLDPRRAAPGGHRAGEGDQHEGAARQRGIEGIVAESAEDLLGHGNGKNGTGHRHPGRQGRRQVEGQQQAGDHGAAVRKRRRAPHRPSAEPLGQQASCHADRGKAQRLPLKEPERHGERRHECDHHIEHDARDRLPAMRVRRRADDEKV